jgi:3-oxoacyl-[acyl-carrier-protein] synthase III
MYSRIAGTGSYLPEKVLTNHDLAKLVDTSDEWIVARTGIRERHVAADNEVASDLALAAAQRAIANSDLVPGDIDLIIVTWYSRALRASCSQSSASLVALRSMFKRSAAVSFMQ